MSQYYFQSQPASMDVSSSSVETVPHQHMVDSSLRNISASTFTPAATGAAVSSGNKHGLSVRDRRKRKYLSAMGTTSSMPRQQQTEEMRVTFSGRKPLGKRKQSPFGGNTLLSSTAQRQIPHTPHGNASSLADSLSQYHAANGSNARGRTKKRPIIRKLELETDFRHSPMMESFPNPISRNDLTPSQYYNSNMMIMNNRGVPIATPSISRQIAAMNAAHHSSGKNKTDSSQHLSQTAPISAQFPKLARLGVTQQFSQTGQAHKKRRSKRSSSLRSDNSSQHALSKMASEQWNSNALPLMQAYLGSVSDMHQNNSREKLPKHSSDTNAPPPSESGHPLASGPQHRQSLSIITPGEELSDHSIAPHTPSEVQNYHYTYELKSNTNRKSHPLRQVAPVSSFFSSNENPDGRHGSNVSTPLAEVYTDLHSTSSSTIVTPSPDSSANQKENRLPQLNQQQNVNTKQLKQEAKSAQKMSDRSPKSRRQSAQIKQPDQQLKDKRPSQRLAIVAADQLEKHNTEGSKSSGPWSISSLLKPSSEDTPASSNDTNNQLEKEENSPSNHTSTQTAKGSASNLTPDNMDLCGPYAIYESWNTETPDDTMDDSISLGVDISQYNLSQQMLVMKIHDELDGLSHFMEQHKKQKSNKDPYDILQSSAQGTKHILVEE